MSCRVLPRRLLDNLTISHVPPPCIFNAVGYAVCSTREDPTLNTKLQSVGPLCSWGRSHSCNRAPGRTLFPPPGKYQLGGLRSIAGRHDLLGGIRLLSRHHGLRVGWTDGQECGRTRISPEQFLSGSWLHYFTRPSRRASNSTALTVPPKKYRVISARGADAERSD